LHPVVPLAALMLLLPFEPLAPLARVFGLQWSHLEVAAFILLGASAAGIVSRRPSLRIPLALPLLLFFAAFLVSAPNTYMTGTTVEVCGGITKYI